MTTLVGAAALSILLFSASATTAASQAQPAQPAQAQAQSIEGELVDVNAGMLTVKNAAGDSIEIRYNEQTQVSGATGGVAGLASAKNRRVRVEFTEDAKTKAKLATRITVQGQ
jgi:hypothetical protein